MKNICPQSTSPGHHRNCSRKTVFLIPSIIEKVTHAQSWGRVGQKGSSNLLRHLTPPRSVCFRKTKPVARAEGGGRGQLGLEFPSSSPQQVLLHLDRTLCSRP